MNFLARLLRHLSIRRLVLLSVGITLLPLLMGLVSAIFAVDNLAVLSRQAIQHLATGATERQKLQEALLGLESEGRRYVEAREQSGYKEFKLAHEKFGGQLQEMAKSLQSEGGRLVYALQILDKDEKNFFDDISSRYPPFASPHKQKAAERDSHPKTDNQAFWKDRFQSVKSNAQSLSAEYSTHAEQEALRLENLFQAVKHRLIIRIAWLLPISFALLAMFVYLLNYPIRQIDHVIRALGSGNFTQPVKVVGTSDLEFLGERLEWLRCRLNDLEMAKQRFVRNVSHEVKTPLATLHEGTDLLLDEVVGELNREQKEIAAILVSNAHRLDSLIAELIHYSQVGARMDYQKLSPVDMLSVVEELLEEYQLQFRGKSISLAKSLEPLEIMGIREQLRTIVDNLLSNAVKYSPQEGEIRLSLRKNGGHMELEIEDDGPGIDPDERPRVFEPFFQGRAARELGVKGTGFGLAIVAECVASHHGKVEALESQDGNAGARIRVLIPMQSYG